MKEKKKTRSELKREAILDAAKSAFQEFGVQGTSMDKLAELAVVSKRTVYNHFATKEDLVLHLLRELWESSMVQIDVEYQPDAPLAVQLGRLIEAEIELVSGAEFLGLARAAAGYFLYEPEKLQAEIDEFHAQETALHRWLKSAVDDGRLKPLDVPFAVKQLHNLVKGSCYWPQLLGYEPELDSAAKQRLSDETVALFLSRYQS
ncbi:MAG: TetR/AcrR family transcriptional regulator C-terminal domain-containing protein [Xanthomonadales bacterium]|nr:TetR/AcrR family transcriptional regulator C-terminal domain-containing protein [Xanthomonadales bacterium]